MTRHEFRGQLICCLTCFKAKDDPIHSSLTVVPVIRTVISEEPATVNIAVVNEAHEAGLSDLDILKPTVISDDDPGEVPDEVCSFIEQCDAPITQSEATQTQTTQAEYQSANPNCSGHECPVCKDTWHHNYDCSKKDKQNGLCVRCAGNSAVEINRPITIEQIAQTSSQNLTGQEVAAIMLRHESLVYNMIYEGGNPDKEMPNWQDAINEHRRDLKRKMEGLRVMELTTSKVLQKKLCDDMGKLSPEEIAQYKRDAAKRASGKEVKDKNGKKAGEPKEPKVVDAKKAYQNMIDKLCADIRTKKPSIQPDELLKKAERQYAFLKAQEEEE